MTVYIKPATLKSHIWENSRPFGQTDSPYEYKNNTVEAVMIGISFYQSSIIYFFQRRRKEYVNVQKKTRRTESVR